MKMSKKNCKPLCYSILALSFLSSGFVIADKLITKHQHKVQFAQASDNAVRYIEDKYGFDAEILGMTNDRYSWSFSEYSDEMELKMKYGDREFYVYADRTGESFECWDDYQSEDIYSAAAEFMNKELPGGSILKMGLHSPGNYYYQLFDTYYDGTNIDEVLKSCSGHIEMVFADTDFSGIDGSGRFDDYNLSLRFTSFDTAEHMEEFIRSIDNTLLFDYDYNEYQKYAPYITDYFETSKDGIKRLNIKLDKTGEFEYAYFPVEWRTFAETCNSVKAERIDKDQLSESYGRYNEVYCLSKPVSKQYYFDSRYGDIWIYYPLEKLKGYDVEKLGIAWFSFGGMSNNRNISRAQICGDYAVFNIPFGEDYFMLVDNSGQEEYVPEYYKKSAV